MVLEGRIWMPQMRYFFRMSNKIVVGVFMPSSHWINEENAKNRKFVEIACYRYLFISRNDPDSGQAQFIYGTASRYSGLWNRMWPFNGIHIEAPECDELYQTKSELNYHIYAIQFIFFLLLLASMTSTVIIQEKNYDIN